MRILLLTLLILIGCGKENTGSKVDLVSCEVRDDFIGAYPEKVVCTTVHGKEVEINLKSSVTYASFDYLIELNSIEFLRLDQSPKGSWSITFKGCNYNHKCSVLYASGDKVFEYTNALTF